MIEIEFEGIVYSLTEVIVTDYIEKGCYSICWEGTDKENNEYHVYTLCTKPYPTTPSEIQIIETVHINNFFEWNPN